MAVAGGDILRASAKVYLLPVAGLSYEILKLSARAIVPITVSLAM